ncbi:MAG TPA: UDP-N-acetylglucosamine 2-epimerase (non-hydrolyzing) [Pyrodictium sp.]|nr:UDP-N-acetylglucosamine 2-epimerase (non-hydrolyzing) [Pyrodictium sp.]
MTSLRALLVVGTRPEIIKMAPIIWAAQDAGVELVIVHSGQHYDYYMSSVFFKQLKFPRPSFYLGASGLDNVTQTAKVMEALTAILEKTRPDIVLAVGDTNTVLGALLAARKMMIPSGHVEAGLRSYNPLMQEEVNRIVADHVSTLLYAPTRWAFTNLVAEGIDVQRITVSGNTIVDVLMRFLPYIQKRAEDIEGFDKHSNYILLTLHRAENVDHPERLKRIVLGITELSKRGFQIVCPCHPRLLRRLQEHGLEGAMRNSVVMLRPLGYFEFLSLLYQAEVVITDSGGVQEEAFTLGVPCVTTRYSTERPETVWLGRNVLVGRDPRRIVDAVEQFYGKRFTPLMGPDNPLGDGRAGTRIVRDMLARAEAGFLASAVEEPDLRDCGSYTRLVLPAESVNGGSKEVQVYGIWGDDGVALSFGDSAAVVGVYSRRPPKRLRS